MRYSETVVKTCTARVLEPSHTQRGDEKEGKEGEGGRKEEETKTFGFICRSGQQKKFLWYVLIAWFHQLKASRCDLLIKKNKHNYSLFLQLRPFYRLRYSQSQRWEVNSGLTLWFKQGTRPGSFFFWKDCNTSTFRNMSAYGWVNNFAHGCVKAVSLKCLTCLTDFRMNKHTEAGLKSRYLWQ